MPQSSNSNYEYNIKNRNEIPLRAYLRADACSQPYRFLDTKDPLVSETMFWESEGLYLDYSKISGRVISISEGFINHPDIYKREKKCDKWIEENLLSSGISKLFVIQGYAGCGKTIFVHHIKKQLNSTNVSFIDIGQSRSGSGSNEQTLFFTSSLLSLIELLKSLPEKALQEFINFSTLIYSQRIQSFNIDLPSILNKLSLLSYQFKIKDLLINSFHDHIDREFSQRNQRLSENRYNIGRLDVIMSLMILAICAKSIDSQVSDYTVIFDNIDVISNPAIPAESIVELWKVIDKYNDFKEWYDSIHNQKLPSIKFLFTLRKIVHSHISSHLVSLEDVNLLNDNNLILCDISKLYLSHEVLKHRVNYWCLQINDSSIKKKMKSFLSISEVNTPKNIRNVSSPCEKCIDLDSLVNHNLRAYSNVLSYFLDHEEYSEIFERDFDVKSASEDWQRVATLVFLLSYLYKENNVWNLLGFGCGNEDDTNYAMDYPTTLNRLILNYLFVSKRGADLYDSLHSVAPQRTDIPQFGDVTLAKLISELYKIKFISINQFESEDSAQKKYKKSLYNTNNLIINRLADMCSRNPESYGTGQPHGYASEDLEMWRRPLYFSDGVKLYHTATTSKELRDYFHNCTDEQKSMIKFSISDEGFTLISEIVASFEFYAARYCNINDTKPLHQVTDDLDLNRIIQIVYDSVKLCCRRNILFMNAYTGKYGINLQTYLEKPFHPRTRERYNDDEQSIIDEHSFRPQLHIVRVIFSHIGYFDTIKSFYFTQGIDNQLKLRKCLIGWIEKYLNLFKDFFYDLLRRSPTNNYDCIVYDRMCKWLRKQRQSYDKDISICSEEDDLDRQ